MHMSFFWDVNIGEFFFKGLEINSNASLAILCGILAVVAVLYEGIKVYSASVRARTAREQIAAVSCAPSESANLLVTDPNATRNSFSKRFCRLTSEAIVFFFHNTIGYALMLSVMVYSGWLFVAVVLSMGLGYFLFGHISMKINMENVQARTTKIVCSPSCETANGDASKTPSPCRMVADEIAQNQQQANNTTAAQPSCSMVNAECHVPKSPAEIVAESDCSCRL